jgi:hypothetical protein
MCHHVHVRVTLSAEDKKAAKKLSGIMVPVYASIVLAVIAVAVISGGRPQDDLIASTNTLAAR